MQSALCTLAELWRRWQPVMAETASLVVVSLADPPAGARVLQACTLRTSPSSGAQLSVLLLRWLREGCAARQATV